MVNVIDDNFMVCSECLSAIVNDDYSGLDYSYDEQEANERMAHIQECIRWEQVQNGGYIVLGDEEKDDEFSSRSCSCCGSHLAGSRHHCIVLSNDND